MQIPAPTEEMIDQGAQRLVETIVSTETMMGYETRLTDRERGTWRAALTLANNICVQESDRHNECDETLEADTANECANRVRGFIDADDKQLAEMLAEAGVPGGGPDPQFESRWIECNDRMPESGVPVIAYVPSYGGGGKGRRIRASYALPRTLEMDPSCEGGDYDEETDTLWCAEGWYEENEYEETHWDVADEVTHWMPLPPPPAG